MWKREGKLEDGERGKRAGRVRRESVGKSGKERWSKDEGDWLREEI